MALNDFVQLSELGVNTVADTTGSGLSRGPGTALELQILAIYVESIISVIEFQS